MARGDDGTWRFIVDAEPSDSDFFSEFGTPYDASQDPSQDLALERAQASEDLYTDEYGTWMSGYAPIRGPDGRAVGIVGVDMSAEAFRREEMLIAGIALLVFAVGVSLAAAAAHSLLGRVADPIVVDQELQAAARRQLQAERDLAVEAAHVERARLSSEAQFRAMFDGAPDALVFVGADGRVQKANAPARRLWPDIRPGAFAPESLREAINEPIRFDDRPSVRLRVDASARFLDAEARLEPMTLEGDAGTLVAVRDLTADRRAEAALKTALADVSRALAEREELLREGLAARARLEASEQRFRALVEHLLDPMLVLDDAGIIVDVNPAALREFRHDAAVLVGAPMSLVQPGFIPHGGSGGASTATGGAQVEEAVHLRADGTTFPVEVRLVPIESDGRRRVLAICRDLTERKRQEAAIHERNAELEARVQERTAELAGARDAALAATRAKSSFLANMSHEIRTPLNAIVGLSHLGLRTNLDTRQRDYLQKTQQAAQTLQGIVNDVLDFSKIEAGALELERTSFEVRLVAAQVESMLGATAREKGVALAFRFADDVTAFVVGDPLRLGQVLLNLVSNAVKFTSEGSVEVTVEQRTSTDSEVELAFAIRDTGIGLEPEQIGRLMQPFSQADTSTTRKYGGTGLGLAISLRLVTAMGGTLTIESAKGHGSTFRFTAQFGRGVKPASVPAGPYAEERRLEGVRVLLVEDHEINQMVAVELLSQQGAEVEVANDGIEALEKIGRARFVAVLMDVQMPRMDGLEATRRVRAQPENAGLVVIAMTANTSNEDVAECLSAGMNDFVPKPIDPTRLYGTIERWLPSRTDARPAGPH